MPLQDSFGKKAAKKPPEASKPVSRTKALPHAPTPDDLSFSLVTAQASLRQPVMMTWRRGQFGYLLTITCLAQGQEPVWTLHFDDGMQLTMLWQHSSFDPGLIHSLITENVAEPAPAAVIPNALKLQQEEARKEEAQVFENYEITTTLGKGGMGVIYKARERDGGDVVALKILKADLLVDPVNVERFKHEASVASSLAHPNLINVREFGFSRYGQPFITMDYLDGVELKTLLAKHGRLSVPTFINVFTQICDALAYAHDKGLIHRDLKPGNIMLVKSPGGQDTVKIIDFGIAKLANSGDLPKPNQPNKRCGTTTTTTGAFVGSPAYMSPEQCIGTTLDNRSDIYSLGVVMYEAISGVLPFAHDNVLKTIVAHVNEPAAPFAATAPDLQIPEELEQIIMKALEKDPDSRYQSAREVCEDLWSFAALGSGSAPGGLSAMFDDEEDPQVAITSDHMRPLATAEAAVSPPSKPKRLMHTLEANPLSDLAYSLLRRSGVITDEMVHLVHDCEEMIELGEISVEQAVTIVQHAFIDLRLARSGESD